MVHLFDGASQALLRRVDALRVDWLAQCTATTRIAFDSCASTAGAVAKTLVHAPIEAAQFPALGELAGHTAGDVGLGVAPAKDSLVNHGQDALGVHLISLSNLKRSNGTVPKHLQ